MSSELQVQISSLEQEIEKLEEGLMTSAAEAKQATSQLLTLYNTYSKKEEEYNELSNRAKLMADELTAVDSISTGVFARYRKAKETIQTHSELKALMRRAVTQLGAAEVDLDKKLHETSEDTKMMVRRLENEHNHDVLKLRSDVAQMQTYIKVCETKKQIVRDDLVRKEAELRELTDICDQLVNKQNLYSS